MGFFCSYPLVYPFSVPFLPVEMSMDSTFKARILFGLDMLVLPFLVQILWTYPRLRRGFMCYDPKWIDRSGLWPTFYR